jgi:hypothetical protein
MLYCARTHVWLKRAGHHRARLGITAHGIEHLGSIDRIAVAAAARPGAALRAGIDLLTVDWAGFEISGADELYHTMWANVGGTLTVRAPAPCTLRCLNDEAIELARRFEIHRFNEETWLAEVELEAGFDWAENPADADGAQTGAAADEHGLLGEQTYWAHVRTLRPGRFAEPPAVEWV